MLMNLVVTRPFAGFARGDVVNDDARIADILASEHAHYVVRVRLEPIARMRVVALQQEKN
jgi:hypothetical protein